MRTLFAKHGLLLDGETLQVCRGQKAIDAGTILSVHVFRQESAWTYLITDGMRAVDVGTCPSIRACFAELRNRHGIDPRCAEVDRADLDGMRRMWNPSNQTDWKRCCEERVKDPVVRFQMLCLLQDCAHGSRKHKVSALKSWLFEWAGANVGSDVAASSAMLILLAALHGYCGYSLSENPPYPAGLKDFLPRKFSRGSHDWDDAIRYLVDFMHDEDGRFEMRPDAEHFATCCFQGFPHVAVPKVLDFRFAKVLGYRCLSTLIDSGGFSDPELPITFPHCVDVKGTADMWESVLRQLDGGRFDGLWINRPDGVFD